VDGYTCMPPTTRMTEVDPNSVEPGKRAWQECFVISRMGDDLSQERKRADYVMETYIKPACSKMGYYADRADDIRQSIREGIVTSLDRAPMCVAYLGAYPWNDNVMLEVGYRLAAQLPMVVLADRPTNGQKLTLPFIIYDQFQVVQIQPAGDGLQQGQPQDQEVKRVIKRICDQMQAAKEVYDERSISSDYPIAIINTSEPDDGSPLDPSKMVYACASKEATQLLGFVDDKGKNRLVGQSLEHLERNLKFRMSRLQYEKYLESQLRARAECATSSTSSVNVPIVFNWHPIPQYINRAWLPVITERFVSSDKKWSSFRVVYIEVSSVCRGVQDPSGGCYYVCDLTKGATTLNQGPASQKPIRVFLSHNSRDYDSVDQFVEHLKSVSRWSIKPWLDQRELIATTSIHMTIGEAIDKVDAAFIFLGPSDLGQYQNLEVDALIERASTQPGFSIVIILLDGVKSSALPDRMKVLAGKKREPFKRFCDDSCLIEYFDTNFPGRLLR
jgi:hypothetical protein